MCVCECCEVVNRLAVGCQLLDIVVFPIPQHTARGRVGDTIDLSVQPNFEFKRSTALGSLKSSQGRGQEWNFSTLSFAHGIGVLAWLALYSMPLYSMPLYRVGYIHPYMRCGGVVIIIIVVRL